MKKSLFLLIIITLISSSAFPKNKIKSSNMDSDPTIIVNPLIDISTIDPTIIVEMRYYSDHNFVGTKIEGYNKPRCLLTKDAATALSKAQKHLLKKNMSLKVYDCYRPTRSVYHFQKWAKNLNDTKMKNEFYPTIDKKDLFEDGYIADKSSHSRGSTVDVTIVKLPAASQDEYKKGMVLKDCRLPKNERFDDNSIDMGTGFDCFDILSHTLNSKITGHQRKNRMLLKRTMERAGFVNYDKEWWHYTLKNEPYPDIYMNFSID